MACRYFWREVYCNHVDATHFFNAPAYTYVQGRYRQVNLIRYGHFDRIRGFFKSKHRLGHPKHYLFFTILKNPTPKIIFSHYRESFIWIKVSRKCLIRNACSTVSCNLLHMAACVQALSESLRLEDRSTGLNHPKKYLFSLYT